MTTLNGDSTNSVLSGTTSADTISGGGGNDVILAGSGNDAVSGGSGSDVILAGSGNDVVSGGSGSDVIDGGSGNDLLFGGSGDDLLFGGSGNDLVYGGSGDDWIDGGSGNDLLFGGSGTDWIDAGSGNDVVFGGSGNDTIFGGEGNDFVDGGSGNDTIYGGTGRDLLFGSSGDDWIDASTGNDIISGGIGNDTLFGDAGNDAIDGGSGDDMVDGGIGNDLLFGGAGNDTLVGGAGNDYLFAGKGNDFASYSMVENLGPGPGFKDVGTHDVYDGGYGFDTLQLTLTHGESRLDSVQRDIADYRAFLADHANPGSDCGPTFHFGSFDLDARGFEALAIQLVNSAPTANDDAGAIDEDTSLVVPAAGVLANDTDPDHLDQLTVVPSKTVSELGAAVVVNLDGSYTYDPNGQFEYLAAGECVTDSFSYTIVDLAGATDTATVTVTVTGENDAPVAQAIAQDANEDMGNPVALKADFSDVDTHDKHTFSIDTSGTMGHVTNNNDGTFSYDPNGQFEYLAAGKSATDTFSYTVTDNHGASSTRTAVVTIHGENDAATITGDRSGEVVEAGGVANGTHGISFASGDFNVSDVDTGEAVFQTPSSLAGTYGDFTFDAATGAWTYTLDNGAANVQALNDGALVHDVAFAVSSLDGTDARTISIAVHGVNDAPMITSNGGGELANVLVAENTTAVTTVIAADVDNGHKLTFSKFGGADEAMFSIDDKTGVLTFNDAPDFENPTDDGMNNTYNVIVQVSDEHGATDLQSIAVTVTGNNPPVAAADSVITNVSPGDALFIPEWALLANDSDPDGNPIAVTNAGGASAGDSLNWPSTTRPGFVEFNDQTEDVPSSFTYAATDGLAASAPAIVNVTQDMDGVLNGTPGNNILVGAPNESTHFVGNSGNDIMFGGNFADIMNGNNGNDTLVGGGGDDTLTGGDGNDIFDYNALSDRGDAIYGFQSGSDQLDLRDLLDTFAGYNGSNAFTGYLQFIDGPGPGTNTLVQVDSDGGGDSFQTLATLDGVAASSIDNSDFIL